MLGILRITLSLLLNKAELWGGGVLFVWWLPSIHSFLPSFLPQSLSTYYVAGTRLVLEKTEMNKTFSLPSDNL